MDIYYVPSLSDIKKEKGKQPCAVVIGRMQPPTRAHVDIIENALKKHKNVLVAIVKGAKPSPKSPFPVNLIRDILLEIFGKRILLQVFSRGFIGDVVDFCRRLDYEPVVLYCGSDRVKTYEGQIKRYEDELNLSLKVKEIKRSNQDISATKVREAIKNNDFETFKSMTPEEEWKYFDTLRSYLK